MSIPMVNYPNFRPYSNVQPFTVRDGATYLLTLEALKDWIRDSLVPHLDGEMLELVESWQHNTALLVDAVNAALTSQSEDVMQQLADQQGEFEDVLNQVINNSIDLQEAVLQQIFNDPESEFRELIDGLYAGKSVQETVETGRLSETELNATTAEIANAAVAESVDSDAGALAAQPFPATATAIISDPGALRHPGWLSRDRSTLFNWTGAPYVRYSLDNGATWNQCDNPVGAGTQAVRDLPDGEILVSAGNAPGKIYRSSGWSVNKQTATFTEVLSASGTNISFHNSWGLWVADDGLVLAAEYGSKVEGSNARYVYLSLDHGKTWQTILDIGPSAETHVHGVAYDKWWKRIWVSRGDTTGAIYFSDDLGQTWSTVDRKDSIHKSQVTTIHPMPGCVLFLSDSAPNGVLRIRRQERENPLLETAYLLNSSASITHIGQLAYQAAIPGAPVLMSFTNDPAAGYTGPGRLVATTDGFHFWELWSDTIDYGEFGGLVSAVGPTTGNEYRGTLIDGRQERYSLIRFSAPSWRVPEAPRLPTAFGDETLPRISAVAEPSLLSGQLVLSYFQATQTKDVTRIDAYTGSVAGAGTATMFRIGLYEVAGDGTLNRVAAGDSDTAKIQNAHAGVGQSVATRVVAGRWYAVGVLCIGPGQMPTLAGVSAAGGSKLPSGLFFTNPKLSAAVPDQTDLPTSISSGSLAPTPRLFWHSVT